MLSHRMSGTPEWRVWKNMRDRCGNPNHKAYPNYGGRGIRVCPEWDMAGGGFEAFIAHIGRRPDGRFELDRKDNDRGYEPGNVRWVTRRVNAQNRRDNRTLTVNGKTLCLSEWARRAGISVALLSFRLRAGWADADAVGLAPGRALNRAGRESRKGLTTVSAFGRTMTLAQWAADRGIKVNTLWTRLRKGWPPERALGPLISRGVTVRRRCLQCNRYFMIGQSSAVSRCSVACQEVYRAIVAARCAPVKLECLHCKKTFAKPARLKSATCCSRSCAAYVRQAIRRNDATGGALTPQRPSLGGHLMEAK